MSTTWSDLGIEVNPSAGGNVKTTCPQCSGQRRNRRDKCLSVDVPRGLWRCHHCGWRGSLERGPEDRPLGHKPAPKVYRKPEPTAAGIGLSDAAAAFFAGRGISLSTVERRKITGDDRAIRFPYFRDGQLVNVKTRRRGKQFSMEAGCELIFWGLDECAIAEQVIIVEGELDKLACEEAGLPYVLSVPNGAPPPGTAPAMGYLASGEAIFARCHTVILAVDGDAPGRMLEAELARRIGREKCYRVSWPDGCKDANEVLQHHGAARLCQVLADAEPFPLEGIHTAADLSRDLHALYELGMDRGAATGWPSLDTLYTVKPGQLSIVTGTPGSGKSEWVDALLVNLARAHDWAFGVYSPENYPTHLHASKYAEKYLGKPFFDGPTPRMTEAELTMFEAWLARHIYFIDPEEPTLEAILAAARSLVFRAGIKGLVIDPWNEIDHTRPRELTETEHISRSLTQIRQFAREYDLHIWQIAHPRIMRREKDGSVPVPTPYDVSGSAHWFNKADNSITVWRNKEDDTKEVEIHIQKIRFRSIGQLGVCYLRYDRTTARYMDVSWVEPAGGKTA